MALLEAEVAEEQLGQLRRLAQSPAWGLFKTHLMKHVESSEREKAQFLRDEQVHRATMLQGRIDGMFCALELLGKQIAEYEKQLKTSEAEPVYP